MAYLNPHLYFPLVSKIQDQLPTPLKANNFYDLLKFVRVGLVSEKASEIEGLQLLSEIIRLVETNHDVDYFISDISKQFIVYFTDNKIKDSNVIRLAARVIQGLATINPRHPVLLLHAQLVQAVVALLLQSSDTAKSRITQPTLAAIMDCIAAVAHDPLVRCYIVKRVTPLFLSTKTNTQASVPSTDLQCLESASNLFSRLYLQTKYQASLPISARNVNSVNSRLSCRVKRNEDNQISLFNGEGLTGEQAESNYCCSFLLPVLSYCLELFEKHIPLISKPNYAETSVINTSDRGRHSLVAFSRDSLSEAPVTDAADTTGSPSSSFTPPYSSRDPVLVACRVVRALSRYQSFSAYSALQSMLHRGRDLIFPLLKEIVHFNLDYLYLIDAFLAFGGHQELCWMHTVLDSDQEMLLYAKQVPNTYFHAVPKKKKRLSLPKNLTLSPDSSPRDSLDFGVSPVQSPDSSPRVSVDFAPVQNNFVRSSLVSAGRPTKTPEDTANTSQSPTRTGAGAAATPAMMLFEPVSRSPSTKRITSYRPKRLSTDSFRFDRQTSADVALFELLKQSDHESTALELAQIMGMKLFLVHKNSLPTMLDDWALKPLEMLYQNLLVFLIIVKTIGISILDTILDLGAVVETILELLKDERLGLDRIPGMQEKCLQILVCIAHEAALDFERTDRRTMTSGFNFMSVAISVCDYAIKMVLSGADIIKDENLVYICLSLLIAVSSHDRVCRRRVCSAYAKVTDILCGMDTSGGLAPLLRLTLHVTDSIGKVDKDGEEALLMTVIRGLRMLFAGGYDTGVLACSVIAEVGAVNQNLAFRLFMRREVEDIMNMLLRVGGIRSRMITEENTFPDENLSISSTFDDHYLHLIQDFSEGYDLSKSVVRRESEDPKHLLLVRACVVCLKDFNPKPYWVYSAWSYGWWVYAKGLIQRPLIQSPAIEGMSVITRSSRNDQSVLVAAWVFEFAAALVMNCLENQLIAGRPSVIAGDPITRENIKESVIKFILPVLASAVAIIGDSENHVYGYVRFASWLTMIESGSQPSSAALSTNIAVQVYQSVSKTISQTLSSKTKPKGRRRNSAIRRLSKEPSAMSVDTGTAIFADKSQPTHMFRRGSRTSQSFRRYKDDDEPTLSLPIVEPSIRAQLDLLQGDNIDVEGQSNNDVTQVNLALEFLTIKTLELLYALLCSPQSVSRSGGVSSSSRDRASAASAPIADVTPPMSVYLTHRNLFEDAPIITNIIHAMKCYPENGVIQRTGLEIIHAFVLHGTDMSIICKNAPSVLIVALNLHDATMDVHTAYAHIVIKLARTDEETRARLINHAAHIGLTAIMRRKYVESTYLCLVALQALMTSVAVTEQILTKNVTVLGSVIFALETFPQEIRVLVEGMRCLLSFKATAGYKSVMETRGGDAVFKSTRSLLKKCLSQKVLGIYTEGQIQDLIAQSNKYTVIGSKCQVS